MACRMLLVTCCLAVATQGAAALREIHVALTGDDQSTGTAEAPFATVERAVEELARLGEESNATDMHVVIHDGTYRLKKSLVLGTSHLPGPGKAVLFRSATETKPLLSGGRLLTGWRVNEDGTFTVRVPRGESGKWQFRELFVNGERRPRARHPNSGYLRIVESFPDKRSGFTFEPGDLPPALRSGGELVFLHDWSISRVPIRSVDAMNRLTVEYPIGNRADHYKIDHFEKHPRYFVEGHRACWDSPGEWYLDEHSETLIYWPREDETVESIEVVAPLLTRLLLVRGTEEQPVRNIHFSNLAFEHCAWSLPAGGYSSGQATVHEMRDNSDRHNVRKMMESAITFERAENCSLTHCRIAHIGCSGIAFGAQTRDCELRDSRVEDISGNGINLGEDTLRRVNGRAWWQTAPDQVASRLIVKHNCITHCGQQFYGAVAVWAGLVQQAEVVDNEIRDHPYSGVSLGWMWNPTPTPAGNNRVHHNHIHHVMQRLSDGGGIYTLGRQPGTVLSHNQIHDIPLNAGRAESNGMFLDQGSDQITITDNVIYGIDRSPLRFHQAHHIDVQNNTLVVARDDMPALRYNNTNPETVRQDGNQVIVAREFKPPPAPPAACAEDSSVAN